MLNTKTSYDNSHRFYGVVFFCLLMLSSIAECSSATDTASIQTDAPCASVDQISTQDTPTKEPKKRRRKKKSREKTAYVTFNNMNYEQLVERMAILIQDGNQTMAIKYLKRILTLCTDANALAGHMLELADLLFETGSHQKAVKVYREFVSLYPGSKRIEYALYRAVCASYKSTHSPDRDQTPTHETIELATMFLSRGDIFTTYIAEVTTMRDECYKKLVESELNICSFYRSRGQDEWVEKRLAFIQEDWGTTFEPTVTMIQAFRDTGAVSMPQPALVEETPSDLKVTLAEKPKVRMVDRF